MHVIFSISTHRVVKRSCLEKRGRHVGSRNHLSQGSEQGKVGDGGEPGLATFLELLPLPSNGSVGGFRI